MNCRSLDPVMIDQHGRSNIESITLAIVAGSCVWNSGNKAQKIYGAVNLTVFIIIDEIFEKLSEGRMLKLYAT